MEGGRGYAFVFRARAAVFPALADEFQRILLSATFGSGGRSPRPHLGAGR